MSQCQGRLSVQEVAITPGVVDVDAEQRGEVPVLARWCAGRASRRLAPTKCRMITLLPRKVHTPENGRIRLACRPHR
jgi:hypothetical protein